VPPPPFETAPQTALASTGRSIVSREDTTLIQAQKRVEKFQIYAQKIRVPFKLADLDAALTQTDIKAELEKICDQELGEGAPIRPFSAQYLDLDDQPLFFYLGVRWNHTPKPDKVIPLVEQYLGATTDDLARGLAQNLTLVYDGFQVSS
jgi:hypothetical protein